MTEAEVYVDKNNLAVWIIVLVCLIGFITTVSACDIKRVYLPDGTMQICRVCKDVVICD